MGAARLQRLTVSNRANPTLTAAQLHAMVAASQQLWKLEAAKLAERKKRRVRNGTTGAAFMAEWYLGEKSPEWKRDLARGGRGLAERELRSDLRSAIAIARSEGRPTRALERELESRMSVRARNPIYMWPGPGWRNHLPGAPAPKRSAPKRRRRKMPVRAATMADLLAWEKRMAKGGWTSVNPRRKTTKRDRQLELFAPVIHQLASRRKRRPAKRAGSTRLATPKQLSAYFKREARRTGVSATALRGAFFNGGTPSTRRKKNPMARATRRRNPPAKVSSASYRRNFARIFGKKVARALTGGRAGGGSSHGRRKRPGSGAHARRRMPQRDRLGHFIRAKRRGPMPHRRGGGGVSTDVLAAIMAAETKPRKKRRARAKPVTRKRRRVRAASSLRTRKRRRGKGGRFASSKGKRYYAKRGRRGRFKSVYTKAYTRRAQRRKGVRKHLRAIRRIPARHRVAGLVRLNPRTGEYYMAKARRVANPRKRRRRNGSSARVANPRIGNPSFGGAVKTLKSTAVPMAMGAVGGAATGFMDAKFFHDKPTLSVVAKVILGVGGAMALRKRPALAYGFAGGCFGSVGYGFGLKMGGGLLATSKLKAVMGIAELADSDPEMAAMLAGMGDIVPDDGMGDAAAYQEVLGDVVDDMGDVVEAYE